MNEVNPEKTYALVVGVEKYQDTAPDLNGPARDAVQCAIWLLKQNVNPNNIGLFISPLEEEKLIQEAQEQEEKFNQIPRKSATFENIRSFVYQQLHNQNQSGELLYVFWSGHGFATPSQEQTERRLLFSDFSNIDPRNLNLNSLVNALKFPHKFKGFARQIYLIDACAHINDSNQYQASELKFSPRGIKDKIQPKLQYILFAVTEGATAINKTSEGGRFSQAIFEELKQQPLLPDMDRVATEVEKKLTSDGMKPTFWKRDWDGHDENNLGSLLSDSDTPTPEEQKKIVCQFLEKVENEFKDIKLFHLEQKIPLTQQYIPIQVTLERRYKKQTEAIGSYAESEAEMKQIYALKGINEAEFEKQQVDWEKARKEHQKIMVLADPGMGKSTLLRMEALRIAKDEREKLETGTITVEEVVLPLFLRLSELATEVNKPEFEFLPEAITNVIKQIYSDRAEFEKIQSLIVEKIKKGQCFLLLDAWDEVEQDYRTKLKNKLDNLKQIDCPIIVTSRIVGYTGSPIGEAKEVEIVPFDQQQTKNYIKTWFENAKGYLEDESVSAENLIKELQNRPQINGLVRNPLLLSLICSLYQRKELELPTKRSEIYKQAVDCILDKWRNQRKEQKSAHIDFKKEVLESFAYQMSCEGKEVFEIRELRKKIRSFLQEEGYSHVDSMAIIKELSEEDGIIQQIDKDGERYIFLHRTFQEYFTASYLNQSEDSISLAKQFFWNYDQHETLTLLAGLMDDPTPLIQAIYQEKDDIFKTQLLLAGRCCAECGDIYDSRIIKKVIKKIEQFWYEYPSLAFIESTLVILGQASSEVVDLLITALGDKKLYFRSYAAKALGRIGSERAVEPLIAALKDKDSYVRQSAAEALGRIGSERAVEPLISALKDEDSYVRQSAAKALGRIGSERAVEPLISALEDEDSYVRQSAALSLIVITIEPLRELLFADLQDQESDVTITISKIALQRVKDLCRVALDQGSDEKSIAESVLDKDSNVKSIAESVKDIDSEKSVESSIADLIDKDIYVSLKAAKTLGQIGTIDVLRQLLKNPKIDIYKSHIFSLTRKLAIQFSRRRELYNKDLKSRDALIPLYPERIRVPLMRSISRLPSLLFVLLFTSFVQLTYYVIKTFIKIYLTTI